MQLADLNFLSPNVPFLCVFEDFVNNTNMKFLIFLYKIDIEGILKVSAKNKVVPVKIELTLTITGLEVWCLSNSANLSCLSQIVRPFIESWSIESRNDPKYQVVHKTKFWGLLLNTSCEQGWISIRLLNQWWSVLWVQFPLETTFAETFLKPLNVNFVQKMPEMSDLCYLRKLQQGGCSWTWPPTHLCVRWDQIQPINHNNRVFSYYMKLVIQKFVSSGIRSGNLLCIRPPLESVKDP